MMRNAAVFLLISLSLTAATLSQSKGTATARQIDVYARTVEKFASRNKGAVRIFADISDYETGDPQWRSFASSAEFEKFRDETTAYNVAFTWKRNGRLVNVSSTLGSPSGDWAQYVEHYFREDGTVAKVTSELRTFQGECVVKQQIYFDRRGRLITKTLKYFDLQSGKAKRPCVSLPSDKLGIKEVDYFLKVKKLPFAHLL